MQTKIDGLKAKASNALDKAKTEMHKNVEELEKQNKPCALSQPLSEQSKGSLGFHHIRAQTCLQWHFTIDVDWVPGSEVGLESLLDEAVKEARTMGSRIGSWLSGDYSPSALLAVIAVAVGIYASLQNDAYLSALNFQNYLHLASVLGFVAIGQSVTVMAGGIDLSVGPLVGLCTVAASFWLTSSGPLSS